MDYFLLQLIPPRPAFAQDMTEPERALMQQHVAYWTALAEAGTVVIFGPVADPAGTWGVAIVEVDGEPAARELAGNDPVSKSGLGFRYNIHPMPRVVLRSGVRR